MKSQIINELTKDIPNLKLFLEDKALDILPELVNEMLLQEKNMFLDLEKKELNKFNFKELFTYSPLSYLRSILNYLDSCYLNQKLRDLISSLRPQLEDFSNYVNYSKPYYDKLLYSEKNFPLSNEQKRVVSKKLKEYEHRGINLPKEQQETLKKINKEYSEVSEKFQHNVVDEQTKFSYTITDEESLKEVPKNILKKLKDNAGDKEGYVANADPNTLISLRKYCSNPKIRKDIYDTMQLWASKEPYDNKPLALKLLKLRHKKAELLGYKNAGEMLLRDTMAQHPSNAFSFIEKISNKALKKTEEEIETLKKYFSLKELLPSDIDYYIRKFKEEVYHLDNEKLKEYFELDNVLSRFHNFIHEFFGVELRLIKELSDKEIFRYEVYKDGELLAYYFLDPFYHDGKRPGAWAEILRSKDSGKTPIIFNVCNITKQADETLLDLSSVTTIFHEFGHALHQILSAADYPDLEGFGVERDFVEEPSQLMENRATEKESLKKLSKHYITGKPLPEDILDTLENLKTFMQGYWVARQNELALLDIILYTEKTPDSVEVLDKRILEIVNKYSYFKRGEDYKMYCAFLHIFGGGYECKYYSYMRAEAYVADIFEEIKKEGMFNPTTGIKYRDKILCPGARKDAKDLFKDYMGRELSSDALLKKYGLL